MNAIGRFATFILVAGIGLALARQASSEPVSGQAIVALPDTPSGRQLASWLEAFNTGKRETIRRFLQSHFDKAQLEKRPAGERADRHQDFYELTRGFDVRKVLSSTPEEITAVLQAKLTESWMEVHLQVAPQPPNSILDFGVRSTEAPADLLPRQKLTESEIREKLDTFLKKLVAADAFSGTVLVARDGKPFYKKACGLASRAWNTPNRIDTKFNLGSMNKMFTSVAIAQLVEQGKLSYDDTVGKLLPDYPNKEVAQKVTVHQLLTHTSGIGDYFNDKFMEASRLRFRAVKDYFPLFVNEPLQFTPGKEFRYSNAGFMVLGAIVEKVSGQDYFDYIREHIYKPAGMANTDCYDLDTDPPNLATGYTREGPNMERIQGPRRTNTFLHVIRGGPAGGGYSTVEDLLKFDIALRTHKILSAKYADIIWTGKVKDAFGPGSQYAYGFGDERVNGTRIVGHNGGFPGLNSQLDMYLDLGYTVAVMSNYDNGATPVANKLREWLTQRYQ